MYTHEFVLLVVTILIIYRVSIFNIIIFGILFIDGRPKIGKLVQTGWAKISARRRRLAKIRVFCRLHGYS